MPRLFWTALCLVAVVAASVVVFRWQGESWRQIAELWIIFGLLMGGFTLWRNVLRTPKERV
jgi:hypothetical protein